MRYDWIKCDGWKDLNNKRAVEQAAGFVTQPHTSDGILWLLVWDDDYNPRHVPAIPCKVQWHKHGLGIIQRDVPMNSHPDIMGWRYVEAWDY